MVEYMCFCFLTPEFDEAKYHRSFKSKGLLRVKTFKKKKEKGDGEVPCFLLFLLKLLFFSL